MNILIIEDNVFLANRIAKVFESKIITNRVRVLYSFSEFLEELSVISSYDIVLVDLKLSDDALELGGYRIIRIIREKQVSIPIVVISGFSDIDRLRLAFEYGASDYIIKPIRLKELELRVLNWFKSYYLSNITSMGTARFYKNLKYDLDKNEFYLDEELVPLTRNNKYILSLFFSHPEKLLTESFLVERIWGDATLMVERNLRVNILRLKQALSPFGIDGWIRNIRGEGYIFSEK
ncbi:MAG: response regulator transcription factor [Candidatus Gracilibacteria bacterium]|nr:response regulator transcription factor [Candidatus Gracilibacteria bacterium]